MRGRIPGMEEPGKAESELPTPPPVRPAFLPMGLPPRGPLGAAGGIMLKKAAQPDRELGTAPPSAEELEAKNATAYMREIDSCR